MYRSSTSYSLSCAPHTIRQILHVETGDFGQSTYLKKKELPFLQHVQTAHVIGLKNQICFFVMSKILDQESCLVMSCILHQNYYRESHHITVSLCFYLVCAQPVADTQGKSKGSIRNYRVIASSDDILASVVCSMAGPELKIALVLCLILKRHPCYLYWDRHTGKQ